MLLQGHRSIVAAAESDPVGTGSCYILFSVSETGIAQKILYFSLQFGFLTRIFTR